MKPIIGIVSTPYPDKDNDKMFCIDYNVYNWIVKSGGTPLAIMPTNLDEMFEKTYRELNNLSEIEMNELIRTLDMCDGIVKPGGLSIHPYHKFIYNYTVERNIPYLGICNGMQLMVKTYDNDEELQQINTEINHRSPDLNAHKIIINNSSLLYEILCKDYTFVNSKHRYAVANLQKLYVSACATDGTIEAVENERCNFNLGVQWHPELFDFNHDDSINLFGSFIEASTAHDFQKVYRKR